MFILSLKAEKNKLLLLVFIILLVIGGFILFKSNNHVPQNNNASLVSSNINSNDDLIDYLSTFNWEVEEQPLEVIEITIPLEFGDVYNNYNAIQLEQGFDLSEYKGLNCKRYSYSVLNYPRQNSDVRANILVYNTKVIGGDISLIRIDGFMHGFIDKNAKNN